MHGVSLRRANSGFVPLEPHFAPAIKRFSLL
nr:MAG TPA: hypothetical protein [Caudoviricetes sp.]